MSKSPLRVAVLGAGPIGLEAAVHAKSLGHAVTVFDRGQVGEHVLRWGFVRMFTPFGMNVTPLGRLTILKETPGREFPADTDIVTGREFREAYLVPLAETAYLKGCLRPQTTVVAVGRAGVRKTDSPDPRRAAAPFRMLVREASGAERTEVADEVLDCTGVFARPNWIGDGGIPAVGEIGARQHLSMSLDDVSGARRGHYAGKSVIVIGGGYSAAASVCDLATVAADDQATWVIWLTHGPRSQPLPRFANDPLKERDRLAARANSLATRCDGNLEYHPQTQIDELVCHGPDQGFRVAGRVGGKPASWEVERVIANVGYRPDLGFCSELRVSETSAGVLTDEPGYHVLGAKSRGRDSGFLLRDGHEQIRRIFAATAGKKAA